MTAQWKCLSATIEWQKYWIGAQIWNIFLKNLEKNPCYSPVKHKKDSLEPMGGWGGADESENDAYMW